MYAHRICIHYVTNNESFNNKNLKEKERLHLHKINIIIYNGYFKYKYITLFRT